MQDFLITRKSGRKPRQKNFSFELFPRTVIISRKGKQARQRTYNVTMRRVRESLLP